MQYTKKVNQYQNQMTGICQAPWRTFSEALRLGLLYLGVETGFNHLPQSVHTVGAYVIQLRTKTKD